MLKGSSLLTYDAKILPLSLPAYLSSSVSFFFLHRRFTFFNCSFVFPENIGVKFGTHFDIILSSPFLAAYSTIHLVALYISGNMFTWRGIFVIPDRRTQTEIFGSWNWFNLLLSSMEPINDASLHGCFLFFSRWALQRANAYSIGPYISRVSCRYNIPQMNLSCSWKHGCSILTNIVRADSHTESNSHILKFQISIISIYFSNFHYM